MAFLKQNYLVFVSFSLQLRIHILLDLAPRTLAIIVIVICDAAYESK